MARFLPVPLTALLVLPLFAVTFGEPDGTDHPYVGLVVLSDSAGTPLWRCSGTLISATVFLTAAHCTEPPAAKARVYFDPLVVTQPGGYPLAGGVTGTPHPHPGWTGALTLPNTHDVGVVILDQTVTTAKGYASLATEGALDGLATRRGQQDISFTVVGYGLQGVKPELLQAKERRKGTTKLVDLRSALTDGYNIHLSNNPGHWTGGTCFGDSGGPIFLGTSSTIVGVNSFVLNENCKGAGFAFRTDIAESLDFINSYLPK
ncbi:MAG: trypsin-like serine protease [Acidobacteria bacterium]|nr:trypsin-like serine protease [Acidobacteriota bacterium]